MGVNTHSFAKFSEFRENRLKLGDFSHCPVGPEGYPARQVIRQDELVDSNYGLNNCSDRNWNRQVHLAGSPAGPDNLPARQDNAKNRLILGGFREIH